MIMANKEKLNDKRYKDVSSCITESIHVDTGYKDADVEILLDKKSKDPWAQYELGRRYIKGEKGLSVDLLKGIEMILDAAEKKLPIAQHEIRIIAGLLWEHGFKIKIQDLKKSIKHRFEWKKDFNIWKEYWDGENQRPNDKINDQHYYYSIALCLLDGGYGVKQDKNLAYLMFEKLSEEGCLNSKYFMARCHEWGDGTMVKTDAAFRYCIEAADSGQVNAQQIAGLLYQCPNYIICDDKYSPIIRNDGKSMEYFDAAQKQGCNDSKYEYVNMLLNNLATKDDFERVIELLSELHEDMDDRSLSKISSLYNVNDLDQLFKGKYIFRPSNASTHESDAWDFVLEKVKLYKIQKAKNYVSDDCIKLFFNRKNFEKWCGDNFNNINLDCETISNHIEKINQKKEMPLVIHDKYHTITLPYMQEITKWCQDKFNTDNYTKVAMKKLNLDLDLSIEKICDKIDNKKQKSDNISNKTILECITKGSNAGMPEFKKLLGLAHLNGFGGLEINTSLGFNLLKESSDMGNISSTHYLADCYFKSFGCEENFEKGEQLLIELSDKGHAKSQHYLGEIYNKNRMDGQTAKGELAVKYLEMADSQNFTPSTFLLYRMYKQGFGVDKDSNKANKLLSKSLFYDNKLAYHKMYENCKDGIDMMFKDKRKSNLYLKKFNTIKEINITAHSIGEDYFRNKFDKIMESDPKFTKIVNNTILDKTR